MMNYKVMLVDDDVRYAESFVDKAGLRDVEVVHFTDWEAALSELNQNFTDYGALIIDGLGKLNQDGSGDNPMHLNQALNDIKVLLGKGNFIPYFINTAYYEDLAKYFGGEPIFDKKKNEEDLILEEIDKAVSEIEVNRIKAKYNDVFEIFSKKYLNRNDEDLLLKTIVNVDSTILAEIKGNLTNIRSIQESMYTALKSDHIGIVPRALVKFNDINKHLDGNLDKDFKPTKEVYQNSSISSLSKTLYWISGQYIHSLEKQDYLISNYTVKALLFSLLEILRWFKEVANKCYK